MSIKNLSLPEDYTLLDILEKRAAGQAAKTAFTFHRCRGVSYGLLWDAVTRIGEKLLQTGLEKDEPVIIVIPNSPEFFYAFYGVQWAGGIAVPVFPGSGGERVTRLARICGASRVILSEEFPPADLDGVHRQWLKSHLKILTLPAHPQAIPRPGSTKGPPTRRVRRSRDIAFIQFTSGSVGNPKGVMLSHGNLVTNLEQMIEGMKITPADRFVSWLPVYHDMGLILMTMVPFYLGLDLALLPTGLNYLKAWLKAIEENSGTFTAAPDFAYRLCLLYVRDPGSVDLSSLRTALDAAEPVRAETIRRFEERFGLKNVLLPAYGLAEATVGVSCWIPGAQVKVDYRGGVSVGDPFRGIEIRIADKYGPVRRGDMGNIYIGGPANTVGYCNNPGATAELFDRDGFIDTGDIGYVDIDGHYYIAGREKNVIIQGGFTMASREIEEWVDMLPFVRRSAAVGIDRGRSEGEQAYIFIEVKSGHKKTTKEKFMEMTGTVVNRFHETFGIRPGRVYFLVSRSIPMTYNGKIKYPQLKDDYLKGHLRENNHILFPGF